MKKMIISVILALFLFNNFSMNAQAAKAVGKNKTMIVTKTDAQSLKRELELTPAKSKAIPGFNLNGDSFGTAKARCSCPGSICRCVPAGCGGGTGGCCGDHLCDNKVVSETTGSH